MGSREPCKSPDSTGFKTIGEVRRDKSASKRAISGVPDLSRDASSHRHEYLGTPAELRPSDGISSHSRQQYKLVLDERTRHSPGSNCSSSSSPPAPAQGTSPLPSGVLASSLGLLTNSRSPSSKPFHENDPFLSFKESSSPANRSKSKMHSPLSTTNGWKKENNSSSYGKNDFPSNAPTTGQSNSHSLSPMPLGNEPLAQLLITLKEQNKSLIREIEDLRIKLADAEGDLKLVRCQMRSMSKNMDSLVLESNRDRMVDETILGELEFYKEKVLMHERDIQSLLEEKEELIVSRDDLTLKNARLNEHLLSMMRNLSNQSANYQDGNSLAFDVDALYLENRYLKEKIKNEEEEKRLLVDRLSKYKELMEQHQRNETSNKKKFLAGAGHSTKESLEPIVSTLQLPGGHVVSARDVERLISTDSIHSMEVSKSNQMYLWNLLVALFEGLQTKNMNLVHARKTNRLLGKRVEELETHYQPFDAENRPSKVRSSKSPLKMSGNDSTSARSTPTGMNMALQRGDILTPDPLDGVTDGSISRATTKETSEDDNDELSSTALSTPSTALSIEQHLKALQNEALADPPITITTHSQRDFGLLHRPSSNHHYEFNRDFEHKPSTGSLFH